MSRQGSFHVATGFGLDKGFFDTIEKFLVATGFSLDRSFIAVIENSLLRQGLALVREFSCHDEKFYVTTGLDKTNSFSVTIAALRATYKAKHDKHGQARATDIARHT